MQADSPTDGLSVAQCKKFAGILTRRYGEPIGTVASPKPATRLIEDTWWSAPLTGIDLSCDSAKGMTISYNPAPPGWSDML
jgi:hypothetical protein